MIAGKHKQRARHKSFLRRNQGTGFAHELQIVHEFERMIVADGNHFAIGNRHGETGALQERSKEELLSPGFTPLKAATPYCTEIQTVALGSFKTKEPPAIRGTGYVVDSLEAALWAFHKTNNFRDGALFAANLGDDADTTGAIYGQIAGAYYGFGGLPEDWLEKLAWRKQIQRLADHLFKAATSQVAAP